MRHKGMIERVFPTRTRRYRYYDLCRTSLKVIKNEGWNSFLIKSKKKIRFSIRYFSGRKREGESLYTEIFNHFDAEKCCFPIKEEEITSFKYIPKISIIIPVYNTELRWLTRAIESIVEQSYENWEICIADDASTKRDIREILDAYIKLDKRIKARYLVENKGISGASNEALGLATGEFVAFMDHDDEITKDALYEVVRLLNEHPGADIIYSDDDKIDDKGNRYDFQYKPDWSPELLLSYCYISHIKVLRKTLLEEIGGFRKEYEGSQDYDLVLRATEKTDKIYHIPKILYHWRSIPGSTAYSAGEKPKSIEKGREAVEDAIKRRGIPGEVIVPEFAQRSKNGAYKINFILKSNPRVSIIIPTKDSLNFLRRCIKSIENKTRYDNYEIVIVDTGSKEEEVLDFLNKTRHKVFHIQLDEFNFSKANNYAISMVDSEFILLLNNDTEVISGNWLEEMLGYMLSDPMIGAVGPKLIYKDGRVQHAGVVLGLNNGLAGHANKLIHYKDGGYLNYALVARNYSAVTAACLLTRKKYFEEVGGFNERNLPVAYNDVDFCLNLIQRGYRIVFNPYALLYHHEGRSRKTGPDNDNPLEEEFFRKKWRHLLEKGDPYYNPNLSLEDEIFKIKSKKVPLSCPRTKNLLFISHSLNLEGAPFSQFYLARELKNKGYKITVLSPSDGPLKKHYLDIGICVSILKTSLDNDTRKRIFTSWIMGEEFGLIYINTLLCYQFVDLISSIKISVIWSIRESERGYYFSVFQSLGPKSFKNADCVVFTSDSTRRIYSDLENNGNFYTIYNGIDLAEIDLFKQRKDRLFLRKKYGFQDDARVITIVGTTCERKGQKEFIEAAIKILKELGDKELYFLVVGAREGRYLDQLRKIIGKNRSTKIQLIPETENVFDYYFISDIFVCASFVESFPRVILEAMAFQLPIIATNVYGIPEEIEDGISGILIDPGNPDLLAEKIRFLIKNENVAAEYAKNAHIRVKKEFSLEKMVNGYQKLVEMLIKNSELTRDISFAGVRVKSKKEFLETILACPECLNDILKFEKGKIVCKRCNKEYPIKKGVPVFLTDPRGYIDRTNQKDRTNPYSRASLGLIEKNKDGLILDLGSGYPRDNEIFPNVIYHEIIHYPSTDVISDTANLPFRNNTFDVIICESVFEHLKDPFHMADEMYRICKKGAQIRVDTAFLQPYHSDPDHFYNMTLPGLENIFKKFSKIRSGVDIHQKASYTVKIFLNKYLEFINDRKTKNIIIELLARPLDKFDAIIPDEGHKILGAGVFFEGTKE